MQGNGIIWCDDKCGIALALRLWEYFKDTNWISLLFTVGEETDGVGSAHFVKEHRDLLDQCTYAIIPDRMGSSDFIGVQNNYCTQEFQTKALAILSDYWFKSVSWVWCDADKLNSVLNCFNISVGYRNHHTAQEHCFISELASTCTAVKVLIENFNEKLLPPPPEKYNMYNRSGYDYYNDDPTIETYVDGSVFISDHIELQSESTGEVFYLPKWYYQIITWYWNGSDYIDWTPLIDNNEEDDPTFWRFGY